MQVTSPYLMTFDICYMYDAVFYMQCSSPKTLKEAILKLGAAVRIEDFQYEIRREFAFSDLLRAVKKSYHPLKRVKTWFVGEEGSDTGGLTREMWRLFGKDLQCMCEGKEGCLLIKHDAAKLQVRICILELSVLQINLHCTIRRHM